MCRASGCRRLPQGAHPVCLHACMLLPPLPGILQIEAQLAQLRRRAASLEKQAGPARAAVEAARGAADTAEEQVLA